MKAWYIFFIKVDKKRSSLKKIVFHKNTRKYIQFLLKFHFEIMVLFTGFVLN